MGDDGRFRQLKRSLSVRDENSPMVRSDSPPSVGSARRIGRKRMRVAAQDVDHYGRAGGTVSCGGRGTGVWLVRAGLAITAYAEEYKEIKAEPRTA